ncbi:MAG: endonuclease III [Neisseriaceae bacterium]|nr:endonuclease III [Neisseriaceae bacterium]MBO7555749.1 endonuclease III [Neisseriaceae bacterium]
MNTNQRKQFFQALSEHITNPTTELNYRNEFELLIAVILSAQATDVSVNKATPKLFQAAPTPDKMAALGEDGIVPYIQSIGLYRSKARHIVACCTALVEKFNGKVPDNRADLESLAGVGRKTANVVLNTAFNQPTIAVDTHIFRVANRTGLACGKTVLAVEEALLKNTPKAFLKDAHHLLILHGRYTCKARKPLCNQCVVKDLCEFDEKIQ